MASEQVSAGSDTASGDQVSEMQQEKPSFMKKVKDKARKLKSKLAHHGATENSSEEAPTSGIAHGQAYAPGPTDHDIDQSDTSESDGEGKNDDIPYAPLTNAGLPQPTRPDGAVVPESAGNLDEAVTSGQREYGADTTKTDDKSLPEDPSVWKSKGPAATEQAVPTNYSYFNSDPEMANRPSDDATPQRKRDVPSSLDGEFAESSPAMEKVSVGTENPFAVQGDNLSKTGDRDSELPHPSLVGDDAESKFGNKDANIPQNSVDSQDPGQKNEFGLVEPSEPSEESLISNPVEQDQGLISPERLSQARTPQNSLRDEEKETGEGDHHRGAEGLAGAAVGAAGAGGLAAGVDHEFGSSTNQTPVKDEQDSSSQMPKGQSDETEFQPASKPDSDNIGSANYGDEFAETDEYHHREADGLTASALGAAGAGSLAAGVDHEFGSSTNQTPVKDEQKDSLQMPKADSDEIESQPASKPDPDNIGSANFGNAFAETDNQPASKPDPEIIESANYGNKFAETDDQPASKPDPENVGSAKYGNAFADTDEDHHRGGLAAGAVGAAGAGDLAAGVDHEFGPSTNQAPVKDEQDNSSQMAKGDSETEFQPASKPDPDSIVGANYGNASAETDEENHHRGADGLAAGAAGAAGAGGLAAGVQHEFGHSKDKAPVNDEQDNSLNMEKEHSEETEFQPADESNKVSSGTVPTSEPGNDESNKDGSFLPSQGQDLGQDNFGEDEPVDEFKKIGSGTLPTPESGNDGSNKDRFLPSQGQDLGQDNFGEDEPVDEFKKIGSGSLPTPESGNDGSNKDRFLPSQGQYLEKDTSGVPAGENQQQPMTCEPTKSADGGKFSQARATDFASGLKNTVASRMGYGDDSAPVPQKATDAAAEGKDSAANTLKSVDQAVSSDEKPVYEKATHPDHPLPTSPGLFDRVSGIASSFFGGAAKHPAADGEKTPSGN